MLFRSLVSSSLCSVFQDSVGSSLVSSSCTQSLWSFNLIWQRLRRPHVTTTLPVWETRFPLPVWETRFPLPVRVSTSCGGQRQGVSPEYLLWSPSSLAALKVPSAHSSPESMSLRMSPSLLLFSKAWHLPPALVAVVTGQFGSGQRPLCTPAFQQRTA